MQAFYGTPITEHLAYLGDGSLLCRGVNICRTGIQLYKPEELQEWAGDLPLAPKGGLIPVLRTPEEIFSRASMASAEGIPLTGPGHPPTFLSPANWKAHSSGHLQNVREGDPLPNGNRVLVGDLLVRDRELAEAIQLRRAREVSMGYACRYEQDRDGTWMQKDIRYNHISIVPKARGGEALQIMDAEPYTRLQEVMERFGRVMERAVRRYPHLVDELARDLGRYAVMDAAASAESDAASYAAAMKQLHRGRNYGR